MRSQKLGFMVLLTMLVALLGCEAKKPVATPEAAVKTEAAPMAKAELPAVPQPSVQPTRCEKDSATGNALHDCNTHCAKTKGKKNKACIEHCANTAGAAAHDCAAHCAEHKGKDAKACIEHCANGAMASHDCSLHCATQPGDKNQACAQHCANTPGAPAHDCAAHCAEHKDKDASACLAHCS